MSFDLATLVQPASTKIVLVVLDGLGGYADADRGTELEEADTPNLDQLAAAGSTGMLDPVGPGITPGSGPAHLSLFGYEPFDYHLGRGALSAAGLDVHLMPGDVAARGNLATLDENGIIVDRRAGRLPDLEALEVVRLLNEGVSIPGVDVQFVHEAQHRVLVVLRGPDLDPHVDDTDPQMTGCPPLNPMAQTRAATHTAEVVAELDRQARAILADQPRANALLLRGLDSHRQLPTVQERYGLRAAAVAVYPMYRGIGRLVGMQVVGPPATIDEQLVLLKEHWEDYDYFFFHHKPSDSAGEDGNFAGKVAAIEALDAVVPQIMSMSPDVIAVTGDHSTPSQMAAHSWHPVPVLLAGNRVGRDQVTRFGERWCVQGALGRRPARELMPIMLNVAGRLAKYGA
ncbi:MAG TPA: 2,3-bisphosphoglycerate-independent phosphoglycerate mutase [Acidimicrobiales bacterium]|nr:2,3-bisphosphoglycerate-independent phosphoglycerate mutase [Acidimicrobiales bacterium]